jgi:hypothetical protein
MIFKIIFNKENDKINTFLKWSHVYHPSLKRLRELSEGSPETLFDRSIKFSTLLKGLWIDGVDKRTGLGRLVVLDEWLISFIGKPLNSSISILDVGGSDGSTTYELVQYLKENLGIEIKATILERQLRLQCFRRGWVRYYLTNEKRPFMLLVGSLGVLLEESKGKTRFLFNPTVRFTQKHLQRMCLETYLRKEADLLFINPLVRENSNFSWIEQDLFNFNDDLVGTFDLIRCCNILNINYFNDDQILDAIKILSNYLKPNGLLLVSRSLEGSNVSEVMASIWMKSHRELMHISDLNGGSEIKKIVEQLNQMS